MDCCKKEEDCCPCESMAPRIECLQAQIKQLIKIQELHMDIKPATNFDEIQMIINEMNGK